MSSRLGLAGSRDLSTDIRELKVSGTKALSEIS